MKTTWFKVCGISITLATQMATAESFDTASKVISQADQEGATTQTRINQLDDKARTLLDETRKTLAKAEQLALYNAQMALITANQENELSSIQAQIDTIDETEEGVLPLMQLMVEQLTTDINTGLPFLNNERKTRVAVLTDMLGRADVTVSEKFRRVLEALQIEVDYGRTIEAYREKAGDTSDSTAYNYLRIGRIAIYRQTLDGNSAWLWNNKEWLALGSNTDQISLARRVAEQTIAPQMITLPVPSPTQQHAAGETGQ